MQPHDTTNEIPYGYCHCGCGELAPIAIFTDAKRGYIKGQPKRFVFGHRNNTREPRKLEDRFWEKVDKRGPDDCWEWKAALSNNERPHMRTGLKSNGTNRMIRASHVSYEIANGPVPKGLVVLHKCDNPMCVNPNHLSVGTQQENIDDMIQKGRKPTKLTPDDVQAIRTRAHGESLAAIAKRYGVTAACISAVVSRKTWRHI